MYYGKIDMNVFYNYLSNLNCKYTLSLDVEIPNNLYIRKITLSSNSTYKRVIYKSIFPISEFLYLNY
jgi:hypothetical protein